MQLTPQLIDKLSALARLTFSAEEKKCLMKDLQQIIKFVDQLNALDTKGVDPLFHITEQMNVMRSDHVNGQISNREALQNAFIKDEQFFKVPKVIKK